MTRQAYVPTIDISPLRGNDLASKKHVANQIESACRGNGFFYASNHGCDLGELQDMTTKFHHALTDDDKWEVAIKAYNPANSHARNGYYMAVKGKKANESFCYLNPNFVSCHPAIMAKRASHEVNIWPDQNRFPGSRAYFESYFRNVFFVSKTLLRGMALAFGKEEEFFDRYLSLEDTLSAVSLILYPYLADYPPVKTSADGTELSFEHHQDVSLITVLYQTPVPNLQVDMPGGYQDIPVSGDCFLVNCGTYMAHITNGFFHAPVHRVKFINQERLSIPFFVNLGSDSAIRPFFPEGSGGKPANDVISYGEYFQNGLHSLIVANGQT